jgi:hypothetical protein
MGQLYSTCTGPTEAMCPVPARSSSASSGPRLPCLYSRSGTSPLSIAALTGSTMAHAASSSSPRTKCAWCPLTASSSKRSYARRGVAVQVEFEKRKMKSGFHQPGAFQATGQLDSTCTTAPPGRLPGGFLALLLRPPPPRKLHLAGHRLHPQPGLLDGELHVHLLVRLQAQHELVGPRARVALTPGGCQISYMESWTILTLAVIN